MKNIVKPTVTEIVYDHILNNQAVVVDTVDASMSLDKLNIDSLEKISLAMDLEEHFEIDVSDQQIEAFVTVADIIDLIQLRLAAQPSMEELAEIQRSDIAQLELESSVR
jgi:acyl carrier protein